MHFYVWHICINICTHICIYAYTHVCLYTYLNEYIHIACMHAYIHTAESNDAGTGASDITGPKSHVTPHFASLDLRNTVVPQVMSLASHNASASGITWPEKSCCTWFWMAWHKQSNGVIDDTAAACDAVANASGVTWPKMSCCTSFWLSWPKECNAVTNYTVGIT